MESDTIFQTVDANIGLLRGAKKMQQRELAHLCTMQKASICRIEAGATSMSLDTVQRIADSLSVTPVQLFQPVIRQ